MSSSSRTAAAGLLLAALASACASARAPRPAPVSTPVAAPLGAPVVMSNAEALRASIVSVRVTGQEWNWRAPWQKQPPWTRTVTGLVVPGRRILVASTSFGNQLLVEIQKLGGEERTVGSVVFVDQEGPLALISVDDDAFWEGLEPLPLAERAPREGSVTIHRWQSSGVLDSYPGAVRQTRSGRHGLSQTSLLTLDVSTGTDGLGESEVVVSDGRVVGLLTSRTGDAYGAIAVPVLRTFLAGAQNGTWAGFARAGIAWQNLTNPALRAWLGLQPGEAGVRITRVAPNGSAAGVLQPGDVLLELAGAKLDSTGRYEDPAYGRLLFALLFTEGRKTGDEITAKVLRDGRRLELKLPLRRMLPDEDRVPPYVYGRGPDYVIVGGLIFQELSKPYLAAWGDWLRRAPPRLLVAVDRDAEADDAPRRFVLLSSVLPDPANLGYQDLRDVMVASVNGRKIGSLDDLRAALGAAQGPFHVIELLPGQGTRRIVLDVAETRAAQVRLRTAYGIERTDSAQP